MAGPSQLKSLEDSLSDARKTFKAASKVGPMPMSWPEYERQVKERHKVLSNMNEEQFDVAVAELQRDQNPMLYALRDMIDEMMSSMKSGKGEAYRKKTLKNAHKIKREASKISKEEQQ